MGDSDVEMTTPKPKHSKTKQMVRNNWDSTREILMTQIYRATYRDKGLSKDSWRRVLYFALVRNVLKLCSFEHCVKDFYNANSIIDVDLDEEDIHNLVANVLPESLGLQRAYEVITDNPDDKYEMDDFYFEEFKALDDLKYKTPIKKKKRK